jgi:hypothetical protein
MTGILLLKRPTFLCSTILVEVYNPSAESYGATNMRRSVFAAARNMDSYGRLRRRTKVL